MHHAPWLKGLGFSRELRRNSLGSKQNRQKFRGAIEAPIQKKTTAGPGDCALHTQQRAVYRQQRGMYIQRRAEYRHLRRFRSLSLRPPVQELQQRHEVALETWVFEAIDKPKKQHRSTHRPYNCCLFLLLLLLLMLLLLLLLRRLLLLLAAAPLLSLQSTDNPP